MKKILSLLLILTMLSFSSYGINDWYQGDGTAPLQGTDAAADIDANTKNYAFDPLDKILTDYIYGCTLTWASNSTLTIGIGEVTCSNAGGTIRRFRKNTSTATLNLATAGVGGIDSGSAEEASAWYSVYAVADADATTFTVICGKQGTALSDVTYYRYIGSFYNNASSNIDKLYCLGKGSTVYYGFDIPISLTTSTSSGAWSAALACRMPSTSTLAVFNVKANSDASPNVVLIRPNGTTYTTSSSAGCGGATGGAYGELISSTDASQQIQHYENYGGASPTVEIMIKGFYIER